jgi:hypothetical protein
MQEEAEKTDEFWYPSAEGYGLLGALGLLQSRIDRSISTLKTRGSGMSELP